MTAKITDASLAFKNRTIETYHSSCGLFYLSANDLTDSFAVNSLAVLDDWMADPSEFHYVDMREQMFNPYYRNVAYEDYLAGYFSGLSKPKDCSSALLRWIERTDAQSLVRDPLQASKCFATIDVALRLAFWLSPLWYSEFSNALHCAIGEEIVSGAG